MSAEFYARGRMVKVPDTASLAPYLDDAISDFLVFRAKDLDALPAATRERLVPLGDFGEYRLLRRCRADVPYGDQLPSPWPSPPRAARRAWRPSA